MGGSGAICLTTGSHLGQVVEKLQDYPCRRITLIATGWPGCGMMQSISHGRIWTICLPTGSHLVQVVEKLHDYPIACRRIILSAPGWPDMPGSGILLPCQVKFLCICPTCSLNHSIRLLTGICQT